MAARPGQNDLLAGGGAAALLVLLLVLGMNLCLAIALALAIAAYAGARLLRPRLEPDAPADALAVDVQRDHGQAVAHLASIREHEARIANPAVRDQVARIADTLECTLAAMVEDQNLAAAPLFNDQLLDPFDALLTQYVRLSTRGVRSADGAIEKTERHDFPMIETAARSFYEKLHRSTVVDLAALGEVLELNIDGMRTTQFRRPTP
ncbi:MAG: hypothetical protein M3440_14520 [Chloroflexota bacterium]|nr:hypothetical protein [Chloroflexota bacterium]